MGQERQTEPLNQKKPWSELTEEEREATRESWKHTLPEEFDVFCLQPLLTTTALKIPGNFYAQGTVDCYDVSIDGDCIVDGIADCYDISVCGDCIVGRSISNSNVNAGGNLIIGGNFDGFDVTVHGDCIVHHNINSCYIDVGGLLDCYDVDAIGHEIHAADYVCRRYEEEI